jgi:hypothetical protein
MSLGNRALCPLFAAAALTGCGAGQYGFAKEYAPLDDEEPYDAEGTELVYEEVNGDPAAFDGKLIAWFGVVEKVALGDDGRHQIQLSHRKHQPRHLCESDASDSCRVTVHFKSAGGFTAFVRFRPEDTVPGLDKVQPGSLLRVFGKVRCRINDDEQKVCDYDDRGGVILDAAYYRQWPARYFVTTRAADTLRQ